MKDASGTVRLRGHVYLCSSQSPPHPIHPLPPLGSQEQRAGWIESPASGLVGEEHQQKISPLNKEEVWKQALMGSGLSQ